jgi:hypothetical protein
MWLWWEFLVLEVRVLWLTCIWITLMLGQIRNIIEANTGDSQSVGLMVIQCLQSQIVDCLWQQLQ